jgi:AraC-like DNA-binding protein
MTNILEHSISKTLQPYVKHSYSVQTTHSLQFILCAKTLACLVIPFGMKAVGAAQSCHYDFILSPPKAFTVQNHQIWLGGMHTEPIECQFNKDLNILCIVLTPDGLRHFLRDDSTLLVNQGMVLNPNFWDYLSERLETVEDANQAFRMVEQELLNYYTHLEIPFSALNIHCVSEHIAKRQGMVKIEDLCQKYKLSRRWLDKQFELQIGISPKSFARLERFNGVLSRLKSQKKLNWGELETSFGYHDKSHLIKDFQAFSGRAPNQYRAQMMEQFGFFWYEGF